MASKLRRTPLFGYDGNLGIPVIPQSNSSGNSDESPPPTEDETTYHQPSRGRRSNYYDPPPPPVKASSSSSSSRHRNKAKMSNSNGTAASASQAAGPGTPNKHVNFNGNGVQEEKKREKFLTAKYGAHQMALIRKRLRVEMWMYERLQEIYGADEIEIDLDEILDMDSEMERRQYLVKLLLEADVKRESVSPFVGDLLEKVKTL